MLQLKPVFLKAHGDRKFVVLTIEEYTAIKEALEDAEDARILDEARRRGEGKPRILQEQIMREFGVKHSRRKRKATL